MDHLRKQENFKLSRQDADLLYLAFDDDQSGSITTREICEGLFKCHHRCPTNILGQRLLPRKLREHHDEKHGLTQKPMGYSFEKHQMCGTAQKIYDPLLVFGNGKKPEAYSRLTPTMPTLPRYQMSPSRRRFNFLYTSDIVWCALYSYGYLWYMSCMYDVWYRSYLVFTCTVHTHTVQVLYMNARMNSNCIWKCARVILDFRFRF